MNIRTAIAISLAFAIPPLLSQVPNSVDHSGFFEARVRPVLAKNCLSCHGESALGGLRLDSRQRVLQGGKSGPAIVPGAPEQSLLIQAVNHTHPTLKMPPAGDRLRAEDIENLKLWVRSGAVWPEVKVAAKAADAGGRYKIAPEQRDFWAFQPIREPEIPSVRNAAWPASSLDRFILARLEKEGLKPVGRADKRTLIRRATFDLIGLPPTPAEVEAFVNDPSPNAFATVVDRLLASTHYGERWARYWLDLARYSDGKILKTASNYTTNAFRYRDWVVEALNNDLPYDRFIKAQLAADLLPEPERTKMLPALGFHGVGPTDEDDRVDVTTRTFLALTVGCAKCHDHKFDPIPTKDYYSLQGVFRSSQPKEYPLVDEKAVAAYKQVQQRIQAKEEQIEKFVRNQRDALSDILLGQTDAYMLAAWDSLTKPASGVRGLAKERGLDGLTLERWVKYLKNPDREHPFLKEWDRMLAARAPTGEVEAFAAKFRKLVLDTVAEKKALEERNLVKLGGAAGYKDKKIRDSVNIEFLEPNKWSLWRDLADDPCRTTGCQCGLPFDGGVTFYGDVGDEHHGYYVLHGEEKIDRFLTGEWKRYLDRMRDELAGLKKELPPPYPLLLGYSDSSEPADSRIAIRGDETNLGEIAPRAFLHILASGEPVPFRGGSGRLQLAEAIASPDNPLTARVIVNRIWHYHFGQGLVKSVSNFGQMGDRPSHPELLDYLAKRFVENGWSIKRLHRQIMLSSTYALSTEHVAVNYEKDGDNRLLWRANFVQRLDAEALRDSVLYVAGGLEPSVGGPPVMTSDNHRRRTLYSVVSRTDLDRTLLLFDFPDPNSVPEQRITTAGPLQKLYFLNSEFVMAQAESLARQLAKDPGATDADKIRKAYERLYSRQPSDGEVALGRNFVARAGGNGWQLYIQSLMAATEFSSVN